MLTEVGRLHHTDSFMTSVRESDLCEWNQINEPHAACKSRNSRQAAVGIKRANSFLELLPRHRHGYKLTRPHLNETRRCPMRCLWGSGVCPLTLRTCIAVSSDPFQVFTVRSRYHRAPVTWLGVRAEWRELPGPRTVNHTWKRRGWAAPSDGVSALHAGLRWIWALADIDRNLSEDLEL